MYIIFNIIYMYIISRRKELLRGGLKRCLKKRMAKH